jgi:hypothetical protein
VIRHERRRKGRQDDEEQEDSVPQHQATIDAPDVAEHVVMIEPHHKNRDEARHQGEEGRRFFDQALGQGEARRGRIPKIQDEQCDCEGEDSVAEGLRPRGVGRLSALGLHGPDSPARIGSI